MTLFNHTIEYSVELSQNEVDGQSVQFRKAIVGFDDFWGKRRSHVVVAPADLWTTITVGGTASAGVSPLAGMVTGVKQGIFRTVWISGAGNEEICYCLPGDDNLEIGDQVSVVEHMRHEPGLYGTFEKCIMRDIPIGADPNLHSINLILFKDNDPIGVIHLDPYIITAFNHDDIDLDLLRSFAG